MVSKVCVSRINRISSLGSSRILSKAFCDSILSFSAWDINTTLFLISGVEFNSSDLSSLIESIVTSLALGRIIFK